MNRNYNTLSNNESAATAVFASAIAVTVVSGVLALFASAAPTDASEPIVLERVVVSATHSA